MTRRVILFNGPPGSGKDTAALHVWSKRHNIVHLKFSGTMKSALPMLLGLSKAEVQELEERKNDGHELLGGMSWRQLQIDLSEKFVKPRLGVAEFGRIAVRQIKNSMSNLILFSDSGFAPEAWPVIQYVGAENVLLVHIHRPGHTFEGDSRSYIDLPNVTTVVIHNTGTLDAFHKRIDGVVSGWLDRWEN